MVYMKPSLAILVLMKTSGANPTISWIVHKLRRSAAK